MNSFPGTPQLLTAFALAIAIFGSSLKARYRVNPRRTAFLVSVALLAAAGMIAKNALR